MRAERLPGKARPVIKGDLVVKGPVVLGECGQFRIFSSQDTSSLEGYEFGKRTVRPQELHRMGFAEVAIGAMNKFSPYPDGVPAGPIFLSGLIILEQFLLVASPSPAVEEVSFPIVRRQDHILWTLPVRIAVEVGVLEEGRQHPAV